MSIVDFRKEKFLLWMKDIEEITKNKQTKKVDLLKNLKPIFKLP